MKIGIIIHSHTGNTLSVAQKLKEELLTAGHSATLEQVTAINDEQTDVSKIQLNKIPDVGAYDMLIFGAPVRGASLSPVIAAYLLQGASLKEKKVSCFVTEFFPFAWMGGNQAIQQMKRICEAKGAKVYETGVVNWSSLQRKKKIADTVKKLSRL